MQDQLLKKRRSQSESFNLPNLNKQLTSRYRQKTGERMKSNGKRMTSMFLQRVKQDVNRETQYEYLNGSQLTDEQNKLKLLLRNINQETYHILNKFIQNPNIDKKDTEEQKKRKSLSQIARIRQQEIENKNKIIEICQTQIKTLELRCENLKYLTHEQIEKQISEAKHEIERLRAQNKQFGRQVSLNGLNICRGERFTKIKEMEYDKVQIEMKRMELEESDRQLQKELSNLKQKSEKLSKDVEMMESSYEAAKANEQNNQNSIKFKESLKDKKKYQETKKIKLEQFNSQMKQKYLNRLKELDELNSLDKKHQSEILKIEEFIQKSKKQLVILEHKFSAFKNERKTIKLLEGNLSDKR